jgi:hypothetical protein
LPLHTIVSVLRSSRAERLSKALDHVDVLVPAVGSRTSIIRAGCANRGILRRTVVPWMVVALLWRSDWASRDRPAVSYQPLNLDLLMLTKDAVNHQCWDCRLLFSVPVLLPNSLVLAQVNHARIEFMNGLLLSKVADSISGQHCRKKLSMPAWS